MNKVYFPNLNGLRFIAALLVVIHHSEQFKYIFKFDNYWNVRSIRNVGQLGVILFFVLSGFLITYLLLKEKNDAGTISIKYFYFRRILRIWPLYYLIMILAFFILPYFSLFSIPGFTESFNADYWSIFILFLLFLPNVALVMYSPVPFASQSWSVGVEEQFYLLWPWIIKKSKKPLNLLFAIIFFSLIIYWVLSFMHKNSSDYIVSQLFRFWEHFNIDCMAIGGIAAWILFNKKEKILLFFYNKYLQIIVYLLTVGALVKGFYFPVIIPYLDLNCEFYAFLFAVIILNLASNPNSIISMENKLLDYLGKISYGLYMYHVLAIVITIKLVVPFFPSNNFIFYLSNVILLMIMSSISYELFEKKFIKMKVKYSKILSGDNAENLLIK